MKVIIKTPKGYVRVRRGRKIHVTDLTPSRVHGAWRIVPMWMVDTPVNKINIIIRKQPTKKKVNNIKYFTHCKGFNIKRSYGVIDYTSNTAKYVFINKQGVVDDAIVYFKYALDWVKLNLWVEISAKEAKNRLDP